MTGGQLGRAVRCLREFVGARSAAELPDGQLVQRFVTQRDASAFEAIVRRHGPMVRGVCRRILRDGPDAEDAFQATFLVLARKAASLRQAELVGNWLYGVAYRLAVRARAYAARQRALHRPLPDVPAAASCEVMGRELRAVLDEELQRLPAKYRAPVVLCYLEGRTNEEAAQELGWPKGTVATRLTRARARLGARLARRGLAPASAPLPAALAPSTAEAALPPALVRGTVQAATLVQAGTPLAEGVASALATDLMKGALREMVLMKLRLAAAVVLVIGGIGAGVLAYRAGTPPLPKEGDLPPQHEPAEARDGQAPPEAPPQPADAPADPARTVIRPGTALHIQVLNTPADAPVNGTYTVEPSGKVHLGAAYGRVALAGLTLEEAEEKLFNYLRQILNLKEPKVAVTLAGTIKPNGPSVDANVESRLQKLEKEVRELQAAVESLRAAERKQKNEPVKWPE